MSDKKLRVGFIGLGIMGGSMAANCRRAGYELTVYNRTAGRTASLRQLGAAVASSPAEVARSSDVIFSCVTANSDVLEVMLSPEKGVIADIAPGSIAIDCSTVAPAVAKQCAAAFSAKQASFLDAPISGGDIGARNATLSIMVGGRREDFERCLPVFGTMGKTITYCGPSGSGYVVKLCNQICGAMHLVAAAEAVNLAASAGVDLQAMLRSLTSGAANSWALANLAPKMISSDFEPGFFVDYQLKDLRMASQLAEEARLPLPGLAMAQMLFTAASAQGLGRQGTQSIVEVIRRLAGHAGR